MVRALLFEEGLQRIDIGAASQAEGVVVKADIALAVCVLLAFRVGGRDPEQRLAVGPAHHAAFVFGLDAEAEERHQRRVEGFRFFEVADADHQMVDADNAHHLPLLCLVSSGIITQSPTKSSWPGLSGHDEGYW